MALLTTQAVTPLGSVITPVAATSGGDTFTPGANQFLRVVNGGSSSVTATVNSYAKCDQGFDHDLAVTVAAGATKDIGPLDRSRFTDPASGLGSVTYTGVASVTVAMVSA